MHIQNLVRFCPFVLKILGRNEILTSIKGHNSDTNLRKMTGNNPGVDLLNMNAYINLMKIYSFVLKILSGNEILTPIKTHNYVNNRNLDLLNINANIYSWLKFYPFVLKILSENEILTSAKSHKAPVV